MAIFGIALICYLFVIQVIDLKHYRAKAKRQYQHSNIVMRGDIFDRNGIKLATDTVYYDVYARPKDFNDKVHTKEELATLLAPHLNMQSAVILRKLQQQSSNVILLKKGISREQHDAIAKLNLIEIPMDKKTTRVYPQESLACHVLGYYNGDAGSDGEGISAGVEYTARDVLEHTPPLKSVEKTPAGNVIYNFSTDPLAIVEPPKGEDVTLTIDTAIQHICERELYRAISKHKAKRGAVIVMNPRNGEILAYAVYPFYNPNNYKSASMIQMKNWTLTDIFPPGSTFKIITISSAMILGKINKDSVIYDPGRMKIDRWVIENHDYKTKGAPGNITLVKLFEHSSNCASVKIAMMMSASEFYNVLKKFGFGSKTGIDLPGESVGLMNRPSSWSKSDKATMSYGYGTSVTAIQMVSAVAAVANGGVRVTPHVIKYKQEEYDKKIHHIKVMEPEQAKTISSLLTQSVEQGHYPIKMNDYYIAAKTGTSKKPKEDGIGFTGNYYTSTIGFLPAKNPQVLIYVVVDSAQGGEVWGSTVAAPIFHTIATQVASILNLIPDKHT
ncbi:MAG: penicillin-binding protein 2 [Cyanobacteria bacterium RUI128]|nr:penicillin-binding protein 2 [Cyanobacteria bacterium RUI128]